MSYTVLLLEDAVKDIEAIYRYIRKPGNKNAAKEMIVCWVFFYMKPKRNLEIF